MVTDLPLLRLLQLVSPGLPIGMYSYSQGLERAVEDRWITSDTDTRDWIQGLIERCVARVDLPIVARLHDAWGAVDLVAVEAWTRMLIAYRETAELRDEDRQTGQALARLAESLGIPDAGSWTRKPEATLATLFTLTAVNWGVPKRETVLGYLWSWLENQILCAVKLVPLGQVAGQRLLGELALELPTHVDQAMQLSDDQIGGSAFAFALASSRHEVQYSRLFRS